MDEVCCGSGCNNCVLDERGRGQMVINENNKKENILNRTYIKFMVQAITEITKNVSQFAFKYCSKPVTDFTDLTLMVPPGHHLMLRAPSTIVEKNPVREKHDKNTEGNFISRPYTPISIDADAFTFKILVKFEQNGLMSEHLRNISVGDETEWKGPYGDFVWTPDSFRHLVCICHGVAVAPIYAVISSIVRNDRDDTLINLLACFENIESILLRSELQELRHYWNVNSMIYLSRESCSCSNQRPNCDCIGSRLRYNENASAFRLDSKELFKAFIDKDRNSILTIVCGTADFVRRIQIELKKLDVNEENIFIFN